MISSRYSPEMRFCVPSPPAVVTKSSQVYQPNQNHLLDQCVVHYPYGKYLLIYVVMSLTTRLLFKVFQLSFIYDYFISGLAGSGNISNSQSHSSLTPMMWSQVTVNCKLSLWSHSLKILF